MPRIFNCSQTPSIRTLRGKVSVKRGSIVQRKDSYEKIYMCIHLLDSADAELLCIHVCIFQGDFIRPRL